MTDLEFAKYCVENKGRCGNRMDLDYGCGLGCVFAEGACDYNGVYAKAKAWLENYEKETKMDGIKVTVERDVVEERSGYPCFKICTGGLVVLFTRKEYGFVIDPGSSNWKIGQEEAGWSEEGLFVPFHGTITIEVE